MRMILQTHASMVFTRCQKFANCQFAETFQKFARKLAKQNSLFFMEIRQPRRCVPRPRLLVGLLRPDEGVRVLREGLDLGLEVRLLPLPEGLRVTSAAKFSKISTRCRQGCNMLRARSRLYQSRFLQRNPRNRG